MKITIDSNEPLEDAIRVIGALYDVILTAAPTRTGSKDTPAKSVPAAQASRSRKSRRRVSAASSRAKPVGRDKAGGRGGAVSTAEVRSWAIENGHQVSDRGPVAESVAAAYRLAREAGSAS